jgi:predicted short-subunit dehydrogenase-like oxidoreductase (DUF2520 family)
MMNIGFIGAGKVGCTLAKYFSLCGMPVAGFYSRDNRQAKAASDFTGSKAYFTLPSLVEDCDCLFLTVPDSQLSLVWQSLRQLPINNKWVGHCSGLLTSQLFTIKQTVHPFAFSLHPLSAIYDRFTCYSGMANVSFTLEADPTVLSALQQLLSPLNNPIAILSAEHKALYHAACVMLSNHVVALAQVGSDLLTQCGLDNAFCQQAWHTLFLDNAKNICHVGPANALTGPIERNDVNTIKQHVANLPSAIRPLYQQLSMVLLDISRKKYPNRDYHQLELELLP